MREYYIFPLLFFAIVLTSGCRDKEPPLVAIVSPEDGSLVGDSVPVVIEVRDNSDVYYADLYIDDVYVDRLYGEAGTYMWLTDSLQHFSEHRLRAEAVDMALNDTVSDAISVTVIHPGTMRWQLQLNGYVQGCPAVGADGTVYVTIVESYPGYCYLLAINPDGSQKWQCQIGGGEATSPVIGPDGTIYAWAWISSGMYTTSNFSAIHPTGAPVWEIRNVSGCPAIGADGAIYLGGEEGLHVYNPDGSLRCVYELPYRVYNPAIGADGTIYFGCGDGYVGDYYVYALNPDTTLKWRYGVQLSTEIAIGFDNTIYFGSYDNYLYALDADGSLRWRYRTTYQPIAPVIGYGGLIYTSGYFDGESRYLALDQNGALVWTGFPDVYPRPGRAVAADSTVYFAADKLYAMTPDHQLKWTCGLDEDGNWQITIGTDGMIYVAGGHTLYAINALAPLAKVQSAWPKVRHDERNTGRGGL